MCYGGLDPKYGMREIEARVASLHLPQRDVEQAPAPAGGLLVWLKDAWAMLRQKGARHV